MLTFYHRRSCCGLDYDRYDHDPLALLPVCTVHAVQFVYARTDVWGWGRVEECTTQKAHQHVGFPICTCKFVSGLVGLRLLW